MRWLNYLIFRLSILNKKYIGEALHIVDSKFYHFLYFKHGNLVYPYILSEWVYQKYSKSKRYFYSR